MFFAFCKSFLQVFSLFVIIFFKIRSSALLHACLGRCERIGEDDAEDRHDALCDGTDEKQDLRAGKGISENGNDAFAHKAREYRTEHHAEECRHIGNDGVEREIVRPILIGQIDIGERGHDRARGNAEDVLRKADDDVEPNGVRRYEGICVIRGGMDEQHDGKCTEPIMLRYQPFPHIRKEDEKQKIRGVDAVTKRIADADVLQNVGVERSIGQIERKGICGGDQDRAEEALALEGEREDIGKLGARGLCIGKFLRDEPNEAVKDGERKRDISDGDQHRLLLRCILERITDGGNDEREDICKGAIDAACGIEIVHAHVFGQKIGIPCGKARGEKLVDGTARDDEHDEPNEHLIWVGDERGKERDADDIDEIIEQLAGNEDPFSLFEPFKEQR